MKPDTLLLQASWVHAHLTLLLYMLSGVLQLEGLALHKAGFAARAEVLSQQPAAV